jgi:hypothetical protein
VQEEEEEEENKNWRTTRREMTMLKMPTTVLERAAE